MPRRNERGSSGRRTGSAVLLALVCIACLSPSARAVQASPWPIQERQPDGTAVTLFIRGDEHGHWQEDGQGYTVLRDQGWYRYAELDAQGLLRASAVTVGKDSPAAAGLAPGLRATPAASNLSIPRVSGSIAGSAPDARILPAGTVKNIAILMRFSDHVARPLPANSDFDVLFNAPGGHATLAPSGSVRDYYFENSYGQFTLDSTVFGWVNLPNTEAYYANNASGTDERIHQAITAALNALDASINFNLFDQDVDGFVDSIAFVHSGYGAEWGGVDAYGADYTQRIWSHRWSIPTWTSAEGEKVSAYHIDPGVWGTSGSSIGRVGVICHETGHFFGLPDLYDTDGGGEGIGSWGLMANSWGFDGTQLHPPHFSSWSKIRLGWVTPIPLSLPGNYSLPQWESSPSVYKITQGFPPDEYLLVENRQPAGFESVIPQGGLVVFHIDETTGYYAEGFPGQPEWPQNGNHYRVSVLQADGQYGLERGLGRGDSGDPYHGLGANALTPSTVPGTNTYQDGRIRYSGNSITAISSSSANMSFTYSSGDPLRIDTDQSVWWTFESGGGVGGPFSPSSQTYSLQNVSNSTSLTARVASIEPWLSTSAVSAPLGPGATANVSLQVAPGAALLPQGDYNATASIRNEGTGFQYDIDARLLVASVIQDFPLDVDPGWAREGAWGFGVPAGLGGDPSAGHTGPNVFGFNLNGVYNNLIPERALTTSAVNCAGYSKVFVRFWRWLGVEEGIYDHARIQASSDGVNFTDVWVHAGPAIDDGQWTEQWLDLTPIAAGQAAVYLRWIMGTTDELVQYCGWNIDDVTFLGIPGGASQVIRSFNMDTDPGFTQEGNWSWGFSSGLGGDPIVAKTGVYMYGFNLAGAYPDLMPERPATTPAINCTGFLEVHLEFWRILSVEDSLYDHAKIQVSNDGVNFSDVWVHNGPTLIDTQWTLQNLDISAVADNKPTVYVRWVMGTSDESVTYGGWSLDDISIVGSPGAIVGGVVWVDFANSGTQKGTQAQPFASLTAGATAAEPGNTVRFQGNSIDTASGEAMLLLKPLRLEASGGPVRIGQN